jgi:hypothetical protein
LGFQGHERLDKVRKKKERNCLRNLFERFLFTFSENIAYAKLGVVDVEMKDILSFEELAF